ncbi:hypothetical protein NPIL_334421 [Nephila pilipes]|uniref:Uncharacterized protein n=1 Tax=Nephila pilipes TaxID=299642 RepID=A0A8X6TM87_NEPPI|nr:hypothetical protein NPIL_334421 [Nephila pilipes]
MRGEPFRDQGQYSCVVQLDNDISVKKGEEKDFVLNGKEYELKLGDEILKTQREPPNSTSESCIQQNDSQG